MAVQEQERATGSRLGRRNDPDRRERIIDARLEVISRSGVAGTSHRKVAAQAAVPLGAMTYYFDGMSDLLQEAFTRFATAVSGRFERRMAEAVDVDAARQAVVAIVLERHFDPETARMLDALIEGLTIHRALDSQARDPNEVEIAVARITAG